MTNGILVSRVFFSDLFLSRSSLQETCISNLLFKCVKFIAPLKRKLSELQTHTKTSANEPDFQRLFKNHILRYKSKSR